MRRFIAALTIVFIGLWAAGAPAWAITETEELNYTVSGPFSGTRRSYRAAALCGRPVHSHQVFDLTVRPAPDNPHQPRMLGTLHIDFCVRDRRKARVCVRGNLPVHVVERSDAEWHRDRHDQHRV